MPVFAGAVGQADKVPIRTRLPFKLLLHRGRLLQMKISAVAANDDPSRFGQGGIHRGDSVEELLTPRHEAPKV